MLKSLRTVYARLLLIPSVGPLFRIPVLIWRAVFGGQTGMGSTMRVREDALSITIAAVDGLRGETAALRQQIEAEPGRHARFATEVKADIFALEKRLRDRVEFARAEAIFELRAKLPGGNMPTVPGAATAVAVVPRILAPEKVAAMQADGGLRINIGCGHVPLAGYLNTDMRALPGVDVVAEAAGLPLVEASNKPGRFRRLLSLNAFNSPELGTKCRSGPSTSPPLPVSHQ